MTTKQNIMNFLDSMEFFQFNMLPQVKEVTNHLAVIEFTNFDEDLMDVLDTISDQCGLNVIGSDYEQKDAYMFNLPGQGSFGFMVDKYTNETYMMIFNQKFF